MRRSIRALVVSLLLAGVALPALAQKARVFVPQPRQVGTEVEYRVAILASNLDFTERRYQVNRIVPQPFGAPLRELVHGAAVPPGETRVFILSGLDGSARLLEVTGAKQIVIRARLELWEAGQRIRIVALPAIAARERRRTAGNAPVLKHGGVRDVHLQGLARTGDGSVTTDLTLVNLDARHDATCGMAITDAQGEGLFGLPFLTLPAGSAIAINDALVDGSAAGDIQDAWGTFACDEDTFTIWAAVYRNGGREVEYVLPSAELRP